MLDFLPILILFVTGFSAIWDFKTRTIPNWLTIPTFFIILTIKSFFLPFPEFTQLLQTLLIVSIGLITFFYFRILGGGDVKLLLVIACSVILPDFFQILFFIVLIGGIQAILTIFYFGFRPRKNVLKTQIPYGISIFLGYGWYLFLE